MQAGRVELLELDPAAAGRIPTAFGGGDDYIPPNSAH
jgi:hypothetical protein